jgi:hypothetical protein
MTTSTGSAAGLAPLTPFWLGFDIVVPAISFVAPLGGTGPVGMLVALGSVLLTSALTCIWNNKS